MIVAHFHRKRRQNANYSIEKIFKTIRDELNTKINFEVVTCPYESNGFFRRLFNCFYAANKQKDINHITGDVNYLNLFFKRIKNILTIHDLGILYRTKGIKHFLAKLIWYTIPVGRAAYVTTVSQTTKNELLKYVSCEPDKIKVIHNPVSPVFKRAEKSFNEVQPLIIQIGSAPNKNLARLIKAVRGLSCKIIIIGTISDSCKKELIGSNIAFENFIDIREEELYEHYKRCDMLFFASTYEGFGMPIVEANIVGRPVITSNLYSMPEVAGDSALLVDPFNIEEIRNGIKKIINDDKLREDLIRKGFKNAERFTLEKMAADYLILYQQVK